VISTLICDGQKTTTDDVDDDPVSILRDNIMALMSTLIPRSFGIHQEMKGGSIYFVSKPSHARNHISAVLLLFMDKQASGSKQAEMGVRGYKQRKNRATPSDLKFCFHCILLL